MNTPLTVYEEEYECSYCGSDNVIVEFCYPWISVLCQDCEGITELDGDPRQEAAIYY